MWQPSAADREVEWLVSIDHDGMRAREPIFDESGLGGASMPR